MRELNKLLPNVESINIDKGDEKNWLEFQDKIEQIRLNEEDFITSKQLSILGQLIKLIKTRLTLKYTIKKEFFEQSMKTLYTILTTKRMIYTIKNRILTLMNELSTYKQYYTNFTFDYSFFWNEIIAIATRLKKADNIASAEIISNTLTIISKLLINIRSFNTLSVTDTDLMLTLAMSKLKDTRQQTCIEGVLLLIACLPTDYNGYDAILPQWVEIWLSITNNVSWDGKSNTCTLILHVYISYYTYPIAYYMQMYLLIPYTPYTLLIILLLNTYTYTCVIYSYVADPASTSKKAHPHLSMGLPQAGAAGQSQGSS